MVRNKCLMGLAIALCLVLRDTEAEASYFTRITIDDLYADPDAHPSLSLQACSF